MQFLAVLAMHNFMIIANGKYGPNKERGAEIAPLKSQLESRRNIELPECAL